MKYILMCGGDYKDKFDIPKPLLTVNGEKLVERTIRLLRLNNVNDIAISTNNPQYEYLEVEILRHKNDYKHDAPERHKQSKNSWLNAYYPSIEPCCYLPGDVYYSDEAIKTIVNTEVENTMFFCVRDESDGRPKGINIKGREPLAYKVQNQDLFRNAINDLFKMIDDGIFKTDPISWNLYRRINGLKLAYDWYGNDIFKSKGDYICIDDYTTDIDSIKDIAKLEKLIKQLKGGNNMFRVEVIEDFYLGKFEELKDIERVNLKEQGKLFKRDKFTCTEEMYNYLTKDNIKKKAFVKLIEVIPEATIQETNPVEKQSITNEEEKPKTRRRRVAKKTLDNE